MITTIKENTFYRAKLALGGVTSPGGHLYASSVASGITSPGGYFYVYSVTDEVAFRVTEEPKAELLTGGVFFVSTADFLKLAGDEVTY